MCTHTHHLVPLENVVGLSLVFFAFQYAQCIITIVVAVLVGWFVSIQEHFGKDVAKITQPCRIVCTVNGHLGQSVRNWTNP